MNVFLAQPAGAWALLGIPVVLLIHFLQRRGRRVRASTLFLLERLALENRPGRRLERVRNSLPLWLQLLAVLLAALLLVEPRWLRPDAVQRVAVILDSSASMSAFRDAVLTRVPARLRSAEKAAAHTEWLLLPSDPNGAALYHGRRLDEALAALPRWQSEAPVHDWAAAIRTAESFTRTGGWTLLVTDRPRVPGPDTELLAVGEPIENCGWLGLEMSRATGTVKALVKNHGATAQRRHWTFRAGDVTRAGTVDLLPQQSANVEVDWPPGATSGELRLEPDRFTLDDVLPVVLPAPKPLVVTEPAATPALWQRLLSAETAVQNVAPDRPADVSLVNAQPGVEWPAGDAIVFGPAGAPKAAYRPGTIVAESDPLLEGLAWSGLLTRVGSGGVAPAAGDRVLLWQGDEPLIFLRTRGRGQQLVFAFDVENSNADRLPAFFLTAHRFLEKVRARKVAPETANFETGQHLEIATAPDGGPLTGEGVDAPAGRAPAAPGFFTIRQGGRVLLRGAAAFADVREADFRTAASVSSAPVLQNRLRQENSAADFLAPLGALALGAVLSGSWLALGRKR